MNGIGFHFVGCTKRASIKSRTAYHGKPPTNSLPSLPPGLPLTPLTIPWLAKKKIRIALLVATVRASALVLALALAVLFAPGFYLTSGFVCIFFVFVASGSPGEVR